MSEVTRVGWTTTINNTRRPETGPTRASIGICIDKLVEVRRPGLSLEECGRPTACVYARCQTKNELQFERRRLKSRLKLLGRSLGQVKTAELDMDAVERNPRRRPSSWSRCAEPESWKRGTPTTTSGPGRRCTIRSLLCVRAFWPRLRVEEAWPHAAGRSFRPKRQYRVPDG